MLRRKAFTIVEVLIVIIMIGVMATFVAPKMGQVREKAIFSEGIAALKAAYKGQQTYYLEHEQYALDTYCESIDGVAKLSTSNWTGGNVYCNIPGRVIVHRVKSGTEQYYLYVDLETGKFASGSVSPPNPITSPLGKYHYLQPLCPNNCIIP